MGETPGAWQRWLALPTLLLVIGAVVLATRALADAPALAPVSGKLARAERAMVYELSTEGGPRFRLAGGAEVVMLLVHLELPPGGAPGAAYRFAVAATLRGPDGAILWERTVTQRARQTKEGERAGGWDYEAAFVVDGRVELADAASVELALPEVPPGSALELRLAEGTGEVVNGEVRAFARPAALMRAYRRHAVDRAARELRRLALASRGPRLRETFLPWHALAAEQQAQRLAMATERMAAEGRAGVDYRVRSIYVAPPRPPEMAAAPVPALAVAAGQPLVLQVAGEGTLWVDAWAAGGVPAGPATVRVRLREVPSAVPGDRPVTGVLRDRLIGARGEAASSGASGAAGPGDRSGGAGAAGLGDRSAMEGAGPGDRSGGAGAAGLGDRSSGSSAAGLGDRSGTAGAGLGDRSGTAGAGLGDRSGAVGAAGLGDRSSGSSAAGLGDRSGAGGAAGLGDRSSGSSAAGLGDRSGGAGGDGAGVSGLFGGAGGGVRVVGEQEVSVVPAGRAEISVPAGWWSLEVETDLPAAMVQVRGDAPGRHAGGEDHALHAGGPGEEALLPVDVRTLSVYALGPQATPLPIALAVGEEPDARFVRVRTRAWGTLAPVTLRYEFVDADGAVLAAGDHRVDTTEAAPFERLRGLEEADAEVRAPIVFPLGEAPVSEAVAVGLIAPAGAVRLRLSCDAPALVAVDGRLPGEEAAGFTWPYDQLTDPRARWRFAPTSRPRTFPRRAEDHAEREAAGQVRTIAAQVRIGAATPAPAKEGPWHAEQPRGAHARLRLLEEVPAARRKEALAAWGPGSYTRLRAGSPATLDLTRGQPRPPVLRYQVTGSALDVVGSALAVTVDGVQERWPVAARGGRRALPRRSLATVDWSGPAALAVLANRPPTDGGGRLYEHRQVHALSTGGLAVGLEKPGASPVGVNVVVYWLEGSPRAATRLAIEVDEGRPARRSGTPVTRVMPARREVEVTPERTTGAIFPDRRGEGEVAIGRTAVVLGDDVAAGRHTVRVRHVDGPAVWVRFFEAGKAEVRRGAWQWGERRTTAVVAEEADADE